MFVLAQGLEQEAGPSSLILLGGELGWSYSELQEFVFKLASLDLLWAYVSHLSHWALHEEVLPLILLWVKLKELFFL